MTASRRSCAWCNLNHRRDGCVWPTQPNDNDCDQDIDDPLQVCRRRALETGGQRLPGVGNIARLSADRQAACDDTAIALIKQETRSGLRVKPIRPEKYYLEARINSGDRIVFRVSGDTVFFIDVVKHDEISRYGKRRR